MVINNRDKFLLFEFMSWLCRKENLKLDYVKLIREYTAYKEEGNVNNGN